MPPEDVSQALRETDPLHAATLARQVLAALQSREARSSPERVDEHDLNGLVTAVLDPAPFDPLAVIDDVLARGMSHVTLTDILIPAAARNLGIHWINSNLSFSAVTVAAGRLQEMLGVVPQSDELLSALDHASPTILVLSMRDDQHTLGWKLVTVQLRRLGYSAECAPSVTPEEGATLIAQAPYDLVLVSASRLESVDLVGRMIGAVRRRIDDVPPIVLGGLICDDLEDDHGIPEVVEVTTSLQDALRHRRRGAPRENRMAG